jgi:tripartite-type tricarboxylate transporter receptor subunit TctC
MIYRFRGVLAALGAFALAFVPLAAAYAQSFPQQPIRFVIGFPPGGSADLTARAVAEEIRKQRGWNVIVEHKPGYGANLATEFVAKAAPDGYTVLIGGNYSHAINPTLYTKLNFNAQKDFAPITRLTNSTTLIVVNPSLGVNSLRELIDKVKAEPGKHNYATSGAGTPQHLAGAMLNKAAGLDMQHVAFKGGAPAMQAMLVGDIDIYVSTAPVALTHVRSGKVKALAVTSAKRLRTLPDIPGAEEAGLKGYDYGGWFGAWAPAGTPEPVIKALFEAITAAARSDSVRQIWEAEGQESSVSQSPAAFAEFVKEEAKSWGEAVRAAGARVD